MKTKMSEKRAAAALAALGHEARLKLFRVLVRAGDDGLNIGEIGQVLGLRPSTLSHHLNALVQAGLVAQERRGREVRNRAEYLALHAVLGFVIESCCQGVDAEIGAGGEVISSDLGAAAEEATI